MLTIRVKLMLQTLSNKKKWKSFHWKFHFKSLIKIGNFIIIYTQVVDEFPYVFHHNELSSNVYTWWHSFSHQYSWMWEFPVPKCQLEPPQMSGLQWKFCDQRIWWWFFVPKLWSNVFTRPYYSWWKSFQFFTEHDL